MKNSFLKIEASPPYSLRDWFRLRREIDFSPDYQRKGDIWSEYDQAFLIDSILNGYDIPKFYLADFGRSSDLSNPKSMSFAIIDGKQRFHAIFKFFNNDLKLNKDFTWRYDQTKILAGHSYEELLDISPSAINVFEKFIISVMSVSTDDPDNVNELFKRLNRGRSLTGAEVRNAALGPVADLVRLLGKHPFFARNVRFSTLRMNDLNAAAKLLLFEYRGYATSTKKKDLDLLYSMEINQNDLDIAGSAAKSTLNAMAKIFEPRDKLLSNSGQVPTFYWFVKLSLPEAYPSIRAFLASFSLIRLETRRNQAANRLHLVDPVMARYDVLDRNTNDAGSQRARISILLNRFAQYLQRDKPALANAQTAISLQYVKETREQFEMDV